MMKFLFFFVSLVYASVVPSYQNLHTFFTLDYYDHHVVDLESNDTSLQLYLDTLSQAGPFRNKSHLASVFLERV